VVGVAVVAMWQDHSIGLDGIEQGVDACFIFQGIRHVALGVFLESMKVDLFGGQAELQTTLELLNLAGGRFCLSWGGKRVFHSACAA
jgi:hypothetical protein